MTYYSDIQLVIVNSVYLVTLALWTFHLTIKQWRLRIQSREVAEMYSDASKLRKKVDTMFRRVLDENDSVIECCMHLEELMGSFNEAMTHYCSRVKIHDRVRDPEVHQNSCIGHVVTTANLFTQSIKNFIDLTRPKITELPRRTTKPSGTYAAQVVCPKL